MDRVAVKSKTIPEKWELKQLSSLFQERRETSSDLKKYPLYSLTIEDGLIEKPERYNREFLLKNKQDNQYRLVYPGDFVFNPMNLRWGAIAMSRLSKPVAISAYYNVLTPDISIIPPNLLLTILQSRQMLSVYDSVGKGTLVEKKRVHLNIFLNLKILVPTIAESKKFAAIFESVEESIASTQAVIDQTRKVKQGLLQQLLTKGIGHTKFKESAIGKIPESWEVVSLQEMGKPNCPVVRTGPFGSSMKTEHFQTKGYPVLTIQSLGEGEIQTDGLFFVDDAKAVELSHYKVQPGDLVFSRVADIGRSVVITNKESGWLISPNLMRISVEQTKFNPWFIMYSIVGGGLVTKQIEKLAGTTGRPVVSSQMMKQIYFAIPPIDEQYAIAMRIKQTEEVMRDEYMTVNRINTLKQGLMQDLLTGKVRVKQTN